MKTVEWPGRPALRAALRTTTDRLAAELACPLPTAPSWCEHEWRTAMAVCVLHGISGLLAGRLRWQGPPVWQAFLAEQLDHARQRERHTRDLLNRLDHAARLAGIPLVALKGSALLDLDLYAPGERPMSDVDLLARTADFDRAHALVLGLGFVQGISSWKHRDYLPAHASAHRGFGEHADNPVKIELHASLPERLPVREIDIAADVLAPDASPGLNPYPSLAVLMRHLLHHAAGNLCGYAVRLIHLHDIAALAPRLSEADWARALATGSDGLPAWWAVPPFELARRVFPGHLAHLPQAEQALQAARNACPPALRRAQQRYSLHDASASRLGIAMLPGLEWSHSAAEAGAWLRQRLRPPAQAEATMKLQVQGHHAYASSAWSRRPRWLKALTFVLGAPPRVQTMYTLHRALAYRPSSSA